MFWHNVIETFQSPYSRSCSSSNLSLGEWLISFWNDTVRKYSSFEKVKAQYSHRQLSNSTRYLQEFAIKLVWQIIAEIFRSTCNVREEHGLAPSALPPTSPLLWFSCFLYFLLIFIIYYRFFLYFLYQCSASYFSLVVIHVTYIYQLPLNLSVITFA